MKPGRSSSKGAFTLIELLVVISIIALLSSIVLASLSAARDNARMGAARQFSSQAARIAGDSAVAIWDFEEGTGTVVADRSGFGNDGALTSAGWSSDTPNGSAYSGSFGGSRRVTVPYSSLLQPTEAITITLWFNPTTVSGSRRMVSTTQVGGYSISLNEDSQCSVGTYCALVYIGGSYKAVGIPVDRIKENAWQHSAFTYDGSRLKLYLDGVEVASMSVTGSIGYSVQNPFCIAGEATPTACEGGYSGLIDDVRVFAKGLTASDIGAIYAEGAHRLRYAYED